MDHAEDEFKVSILSHLGLLEQLHVLLLLLQCLLTGRDDLAHLGHLRAQVGALGALGRQVRANGLQFL
jgi:hypothetical protein